MLRATLKNLLYFTKKKKQNRNQRMICSHYFLGVNFMLTLIDWPKDSKVNNNDKYRTNTEKNMRNKTLFSRYFGIVFMDNSDWHFSIFVFFFFFLFIFYRSIHSVSLQAKWRCELIWTQREKSHSRSMRRRKKKLFLDRMRDPRFIFILSFVSKNGRKMTSMLTEERT